MCDNSKWPVVGKAKPHICLKSRDFFCSQGYNRLWSARNKVGCLSENQTKRPSDYRSHRHQEFKPALMKPQIPALASSWPTLLLADACSKGLSRLPNLGAATTTVGCGAADITSMDRPHMTCIWKVPHRDPTVPAPTVRFFSLVQLYNLFNKHQFKRTSVRSRFEILHLPQLFAIWYIMPADQNPSCLFSPTKVKSITINQPWIHHH